MRRRPSSLPRPVQCLPSLSIGRKPRHHSDIRSTYAIIFRQFLTSTAVHSPRPRSIPPKPFAPPHRSSRLSHPSCTDDRSTPASSPPPIRASTPAPRLARSSASFSAPLVASFSSSGSYTPASTSAVPHLPCTKKRSCDAGLTRHGDPYRVDLAVR